MQKFDLVQLGHIAMQEGRPVRILDDVFTIGSISEGLATLQIPNDLEKKVLATADENWQEIARHELFNGSISAVNNIFCKANSLHLELVEIDYRLFCATDLILERVPGYFPPLAVGVHAYFCEMIKF